MRTIFEWVAKRRFNYIDGIGMWAVSSLITEGRYLTAAITFFATTIVSIIFEMAMDDTRERGK